MSPVTQKYPDNWKEFSGEIRSGRAGGRCECSGECGLHSTHPGRRRCVEVNGTRALFARGLVVLTVAHLCECDPLCAITEHVKAMCNRCHLRVDVDLHVKHAAASRMRKKETAGQMSMLDRLER